MTSEEINVLAMIKGEERYIFIYNDENRIEMLRTLGRYAADPQLSFSWYDAAVMSKKVRDMAHQELAAQVDSPAATDGLAESRRFSYRQEEDLI